MSCAEYERISHEIEHYRDQIKYFLFLKAVRKISNEKAQRSSKEAAVALARASNRLHWHQTRCSVCRRAVTTATQT